LITKERKRAAEKQRFVHVLTEPIQGYFGPEVMLKACQAIRHHFFWHLSKQGESS
jgi:hypothetical protein